MTRETKQGDTPTIEFTVEGPSGSALDLSDVDNVQLYIQHNDSGDLVTNQSVTPTTPAEGKVEYQLSEGETARIGRHDVEIVVEGHPDLGVRYSWPRETFRYYRVNEPLDRDVTLEETSDPGDADVSTLRIHQQVDAQGNDVTNVGALDTERAETDDLLIQNEIAFEFTERINFNGESSVSIDLPDNDHIYFVFEGMGSDTTAGYEFRITFGNDTDANYSYELTDGTTTEDDTHFLMAKGAREDQAMVSGIIKIDHSARDDSIGRDGIWNIGVIGHPMESSSYQPPLLKGNRTTGSNSSTVQLEWTASGGLQGSVTVLGSDLPILG